MGDAVRGAIDVIAQLQSDLAAARATNRDLHRRTQKAERFRDRWKSWSWMFNKRLAEARRRRKAENDLIALAKMYGEACGELQSLRWLVNGTASVDDLVARLLIEAGEERRAAEAEAAQLRSRLLEAEKGAEAMRKALKPFADVCDADHMRYVKDEQVLELSTRAEVPISEKLRGRDFRAAKLALLTQEESR